MNKLSIVIISSLLSFSAFSAEKTHPCENIKKSCEAAGFIKGEHKKTGKGLYIDCMQPVLEGKTVAGVTATADDIAACKVKEAEHKAKKEAKK
jgi:hypothetical protein